jgi:hypothetical protein
MAQKKIGIYGNLESTANNKVEDLYLIVDGQSIVFSVKNNISQEYVSFEYFLNTGDNQGWSQLMAYLQNNSKLMHAFYKNINFIINTPRIVLSNINSNLDVLQYQNELNLVHGVKSEEEIYTNEIGLGSIIVYGVPDALSTLLTRAFPTGKWNHYASYLMNNFRDNGVYIQLFDNNFCLYIVEAGKVKILNYFPIEGNDQNSFMVLNACVNTDTNTNSIPLIVYGYNPEQHEFIKMVAPYFESLQLEKAPAEGIGSKLNLDYPNHTYSTYFIF